MYSQEPLVLTSSDYYIYTPSQLAQKLYLYPVCTGYFRYMPGYFISRSHYDSFLVMQITNGCCQIETSSMKALAKKGDFVLLDCYIPHCYGNENSWEALWLHFDGRLARTYFEEITSRHGQILSPMTAHSCSHYLKKIYKLFRDAGSITESELSADITALLDQLLNVASRNTSGGFSNSSVENAISYINKHFQEDISLEMLAETANLSLYYFIKIFSKQTGFTPYQYIMNTRITAAKYLLKTPELSIKDIAFRTGFHSESSFCTSFKKYEDVTPSQYRKRILM
ncbi:MAG: AraC family transcriptional regulator [Hominisplanchenecus sp.]